MTLGVPYAPERIGGHFRLKSQAGVGSKMELARPTPLVFEDTAQHEISKWITRLNREAAIEKLGR
jgi:hypothetical protein